MPALKTHRLFAALPVPAEIREELYRLNSSFPGLRFSRNLHLTLFFIPAADNVDEYAKALGQIQAPPFRLALTGLGSFGGRVLWAGVESAPGLLNLQRRIAARMEAMGEEGEKRPYTPHITLCRLKSALSPSMKRTARAAKCAGAWEANEFCLYESELHPGQALHKIIEVYPLKA